MNLWKYSTKWSFLIAFLLVLPFLLQGQSEYWKKGQAAEAKGNLLFAEGFYRAAERDNKNDRQAQQSLAELLFHTLRFKEAQHYFSLAQLPPDTIEFIASSTMLGDALIHEFIESEKLFTEEELLFQIEMNPQNADAYLNLVLWYYRDQPEKAEATYRQLLGVLPNEITGLERYGRLLLDLGRYAESEIFLDHAKSIEPGNVSIQRLLANLYIKWGRKQAQEDVYLDALELNPEDSVTFRSLIYLYQDLDRYVEAELLLLEKQPRFESDLLILYNNWLEDFPGKPSLHIKLGDIYSKKANHYSAAEQYDLALSFMTEDDPALASVFYKLGESRFALEQYIAAARAFENTDYFIRLAEAYHQAFEYENALNLLEDLQAKGLIDFQRQKRLAHYLAIQGRHAEAEELAAYIIEHHPTRSDPTAFLIRANNLYLMKRYEDALAQYQYVIELEHMHAEAYYSMARCKKLLGRSKEADELKFIAEFKGFVYGLVTEFDPVWR